MICKVVLLPLCFRGLPQRTQSSPRSRERNRPLSVASVLSVAILFSSQARRASVGFHGPMGVLTQDGLVDERTVGKLFPVCLFGKISPAVVNSFLVRRRWRLRDTIDTGLGTVWKPPQFRCSVDFSPPYKVPSTPHRTTRSRSLASGLSITLDLLTKTENEAATQVLIRALDSADPAVQEGAWWAC